MEGSPVFTARISSPLGGVALTERGGRLIGIRLEGQRPIPHTDGAQARMTPVLKQTAQWLERYFAGERPPAGELPLAPEGSAFRQVIWELLLQIPCGQVWSYGALAAQAAQRMCRARMSAQAVGGAVGHNPIAIVIPCHRVVGADGSMTGYDGGIDKKVWLLAHEQAQRRA